MKFVDKFAVKVMVTFTVVYDGHVCGQVCDEVSGKFAVKFVVSLWSCLVVRSTDCCVFGENVASFHNDSITSHVNTELQRRSEDNELQQRTYNRCRKLV